MITVGWLYGALVVIVVELALVAAIAAGAYVYRERIVKAAVRQQMKRAAAKGPARAR